MAKPFVPSTATKLLFIISSCFCVTWSSNAQSLHFNLSLKNDSNSIKLGSTDYGNLVHETPSAVLYPSSVNDIIDLIRSSNLGPTPFTVAAKGHGHSVRGQAMTCGGVVVEMAALSKNGTGIRVFGNDLSGYYADVGGEQLWIDVLHATLEHGVAPVSWTDYLYLSVGGTLSNAGISGQAFSRGPQISNVLELDVITGKGEFITCSKDSNPELFFGVLGGLGQFGIITRARIVLEKAPTRAKWARVIYSNFTDFSSDQERLISSNDFNYVEGLLFTDEISVSSWRPLFNTTSNQSAIVSQLKEQGIIYCIELVKYYDNQTAGTIDQEFEKLLRELHNDVDEYGFDADVSFSFFLDRVGNLDNVTTGAVVQTHPWLNLFIPKSRIFDFNDNVLVNMLPKLNETNGVFILYPFNRNKWDDRMSAVTPDEDVFYTLALLHTSSPSDSMVYDNFNNQILEYCEKAGIKVKQYLPNFKSKEEAKKQFGRKWRTFLQRKIKFDPKMILSPGQGIFNSAPYV